MIYRKGRRHSRGLGVDERIILKLILRKQGGMMWTELFWLRIGTCGGLF
jgi:hypothetical protein